MKITSVDTFVLSNRRLLVKVSTDAGITGWGEPTLENWARTAAAAVDRLAEHLIGQDPRRINRLWETMTRGGFYRGGAVLSSAVAGLDQALWDITARSLGAPVHELLGGAVRDRIRMYAHSNGYPATGDVDRARELIAAGYTLLKIVPTGPVAFIESAETLNRIVEDVTAFRDAIGDAVDFAIDLHGRFSLPLSRRLLPLLEPLAPAFVEEPTRPEHSLHLAGLVSSTSIPIAAGERAYSRAEAKVLLDAGVAVLQPDVSHAGGITETVRIASLAELYDAQIAPHCPLGPVALAACLQVDAVVSNFYAQEQVIDIHDPDSPDLAIIHNPQVLAPIDGFVTVPSGPGLGVEVDEDAIRARVVDGQLEPGSPIWSNPDGSFAEW